MVNSEIYGGLLSALQRGSSWYDAMMSLYNAGYAKEEIEETAGILKAHLTGKVINKVPEPQTVEKQIPPSQPALKPAFSQKPRVNLKPVSNIPSVLVPSRMPPVAHTAPRTASAQVNPPVFRQNVSSYAISPRKEIPAPVQIPPKNVVQPLQPVVQKVSHYPATTFEKPPFERKTKVSLAILFILLIILFGVLIGLFLFKDKIFEFLGSFSF